MSVFQEMQRKAFHMLSLVYLLAYWLIGYPRVMPWMYAWAAVVVVVELGRVYIPGINRFLMRGIFAKLSRPEEHKHVSGIFHTTLGVLILWAFFGDQPKLVAAAIFCVAFGDAAAAIVGKSIGRTRLFGSKKSVEGSAACWAACFLSCRLTGFGALACAAAATASTAVEWFPTTAWFNDNLWLPVAAAGALRLLI